MTIVVSAHIRIFICLVRLDKLSILYQFLLDLVGIEEESIDIQVSNKVKFNVHAPHEGNF